MMGVRLGVSYEGTSKALLRRCIGTCKDDGGPFGRGLELGLLGENLRLAIVDFRYAPRHLALKRQYETFI